jgi:hypothetical protein
MEIITISLAILGAIVLADTIKVYIQSSRNELAYLRKTEFINLENAKYESAKEPVELELIQELGSFNIRLIAPTQPRLSVYSVPIELNLSKDVIKSLQNTGRNVKNHPSIQVKQQEIFSRSDRQLAHS